jgi:hypothetical protein
LEKNQLNSHLLSQSVEAIVGRHYPKNALKGLSAEEVRQLFTGKSKIGKNSAAKIVLFQFGYIRDNEIQRDSTIVGRSPNHVISIPCASSRQLF